MKETPETRRCGCGAPSLPDSPNCADCAAGIAGQEEYHRRKANSPAYRAHFDAMSRSPEMRKFLSRIKTAPGHGPARLGGE